MFDIISEPQFLELKIKCLLALVFTVRTCIFSYKILKIVFKDERLMLKKETIIKFFINRINDLLISIIGGLSLVELDNLVVRYKNYKMYRNIILILLISFLIKLILKFIKKDFQNRKLVKF